jgi:hypothetical protein
MLSDGLDRGKVRTVKILVSVEKADQKLRSMFKDLQAELATLGIKCEFRVIVDTALRASIHDRWIKSRSKCFNVPSPDTIERGQFSEIKETTNRPPFDEWWTKSIDIIDDWNELAKSK